MKRRNINLVLSFLGLIFVGMAFQNCAKEDMSFQDSIYDDSLKFFNYKYTSAAPYYYDIKVLKGPVENNQETFQVVGSINRSNPNDTKSISWEIRILDTDGGNMPTIEGDDIQDGTLVYVDGLAAAVGKTYNTLEIKITYEGETKTYLSPLAL